MRLGLMCKNLLTIPCCLSVRHDTDYSLITFEFDSSWNWGPRWRVEGTSHEFDVRVTIKSKIVSHSIVGPGPTILVFKHREECKVFGFAIAQAAFSGVSNHQDYIQVSPDAYYYYYN